MLELFFAFILICTPDGNPSTCDVVRGPYHATVEECRDNLMTEGLSYLASTYGGDAHVAHISCQTALFPHTPT